MRKLLLTLIIFALPPIVPALAQQSQSSMPEASPEVRQMCRAALFKLCNPGGPPDREAIRHCAEENRDKLPPQCSMVFAGQKRP
jgi:hypothetical protein